MCNLYSQTKGQAAIIALTHAMRDITGNMSLHGSFDVVDQGHYPKAFATGEME